MEMKNIKLPKRIGKHCFNLHYRFFFRPGSQLDFLTFELFHLKILSGADYSYGAKGAMPPLCNFLPPLPPLAICPVCPPPPGNFLIFPLLTICPVFFTGLVFIII